MSQSHGGLKSLPGPPAAGEELVFQHVTLLVPGAGVIQDASIHVSRNGTIEQFGPCDQVPVPPSAKTVDGTGFMVTPGLVNAHTHAPLAFFRGQGHGKTNMIETFLFPAEKKLTPDLTEGLSYSCLVEGLKCGVTTFADHYY